MLGEKLFSYQLLLTDSKIKFYLAVKADWTFGERLPDSFRLRRRSGGGRVGGRSRACPSMPRCEPPPEEKGTIQDLAHAQSETYWSSVSLETIRFLIIRTNENVSLPSRECAAKSGLLASARKQFRPRAWTGRKRSTRWLTPSAKATKHSQAWDEEILFLLLFNCLILIWFN